MLNVWPEIAYADTRGFECHGPRFSCSVVCCFPFIEKIQCAAQLPGGYRADRQNEGHSRWLAVPSTQQISFTARDILPHSVYYRPVSPGKTSHSHTLHIVTWCRLWGGNFFFFKSENCDAVIKRVCY